MLAKAGLLAFSGIGIRSPRSSTASAKRGCPRTHACAFKIGIDFWVDGLWIWRWV